MKKLLFALFALLLFCGCAKEAIRPNETIATESVIHTDQTNNYHIIAEPQYWIYDSVASKWLYEAILYTSEVPRTRVCANGKLMPYQSGHESFSYELIPRNPIYAQLEVYYYNDSTKQKPQSNVDLFLFKPLFDYGDLYSK